MTDILAKLYAVANDGEAETLDDDRHHHNRGQGSLDTTRERARP